MQKNQVEENDNKKWDSIHVGVPFFIIFIFL